jgi:hypothetical protein
MDYQRIYDAFIADRLGKCAVKTKSPHYWRLADGKVTTGVANRPCGMLLVESLGHLRAAQLTKQLYRR